MKNDLKYLKHRPNTLRVNSDACKYALSNSSQEAHFRDRALNFLRSITSNSAKPCNILFLSNPLHLIPCESTPHLGITRTQEEQFEISKIQAWVTSGVIKKSYKHCLSIHSNLIPKDRNLIQVVEYPGYIVPSPIKDKLNEDFAYLHPHLEPQLTLSKLSNLREDLIFKVWKKCELDPATLAVGLTCFDRLLDLNLINKINRKLFAAACVLLAYKFFEENHVEEVKEKYKEMISQLYHMDKKDLLTTKIIFEAEFTVYAYLNFSIHFELEDISENLKYVRNRLNA